MWFVEQVFLWVAMSSSRIVFFRSTTNKLEKGSLKLLWSEAGFIIFQRSSERKLQRRGRRYFKRMARPRAFRARENIEHQLLVAAARLPRFSERWGVGKLFNKINSMRRVTSTAGASLARTCRTEVVVVVRIRKSSLSNARRKCTWNASSRRVFGSLLWWLLMRVFGHVE